MNEPANRIDFQAITKQTQQLDLTEDRAVNAEYNSESKKLIVHMMSGVDIAIPVDLIEGLHDATDAQRAHFIVTASGRGLHWDSIDVQLSVQGLLKGLYGSPLWLQRFAAAA